MYRKFGFLLPRARKHWTRLLFLSAFTASSINAQDEEIARPSSETIEIIQKATELSDEDTHSAEEMLRNQEGKVEPASIDDAYLKLTRIQLLLESDRLQEAIDPLRKTIGYNILEPKTQERTVRGLGHVYYQLDRRKEMVELFERHFRNPEALSMESLQIFAVGLLEEENPSRALQMCEVALSKSVDLNRSLCQIAAASLQAMDRLQESAKYIELMLSQDSGNAVLWDQLISSYFRSGNLWAAYGAIERAQQLGLKNDDSTHVSKIEILFELEHFAAAASKMEARVGNPNATIQKRDWLLLINCYDQQNLSEKAIAALERASRISPWPEMDLQLADRHWRSGDYAAVFEDVKRAFDKGNVEKPGDAWTLAAAAAISLGRIDDAALALDEARAAGSDPRKIGQLERSLDRARALEKENT